MSTKRNRRGGKRSKRIDVFDDPPLSREEQARRRTIARSMTPAMSRNIARVIRNLSIASAEGEALCRDLVPFTMADRLECPPVWEISAALDEPPRIIPPDVLAGVLGAGARLVEDRKDRGLCPWIEPTSKRGAKGARRAGRGGLAKALTNLIEGHPDEHRVMRALRAWLAAGSPSLTRPRKSA